MTDLRSVPPGHPTARRLSSHSRTRRHPESGYSPVAGYIGAPRGRGRAFTGAGHGCAKMLPVTGQEAQPSARQARDRYVVRPAAELTWTRSRPSRSRSRGFRSATRRSPTRHSIAAGWPGRWQGPARSRWSRSAGRSRPCRWGGPGCRRRTNSLTGERYGNFRSLARHRRPGEPDRGARDLGELLMTAILAAADEAGFTHLSGKVNAANSPCARCTAPSASRRHT